MDNSQQPTRTAPMRILVVDDHPNTATTLARAISQIGPDLEVVAATSGKTALEHVQHGAVDFLITDMMMPDINGLELIEKVQSHPAGRPVYTILITAYDVPGLKVSARRLQVNEILIKPIRPDLLCQSVRRVLDNWEGTKSPRSVSETTQPSFRILVADDKPDNITLLSRYLTSEGYSIITATDGEETLQKVRADLPDLVLLDVNMPKKDGFEVLKEIRADAAIKFIPVIILTAARIDPLDMQSGLYLGADDYVTKPFERRELMARIRTKLRVKQAEDVIRRQNKELNILPEIGKELSTRMDVNGLADILLRRTVETLGALYGYVLILDPKGPLHKEYSISSPSRPQAPSKFPPLNTLADEIRETRQTLIVEDTRTDPRWQTTADDPTRSVIVVPLFGRQLIGLLVLTHEQKEYFNIGHQVLLQAIASQAAVAMENAWLYSSVSQEQQRLAAVLQNAADAILMFESDGCLSLINPAAQVLFTGFELKVGLPLARGKGYETLIQVLEETSVSGKAVTAEILWPDHRTFTALVTPLKDGGCVVIMHDVTRFKDLERVKNEFISTASHDLRNPITSIKGYSVLIQHAGPLNENQVDFAKRIQRGAEHMTQLVENMLDLAKMDMDVKFAQDIVDVTPILTELADEFRPQAETKNQQLVLAQTQTNSNVRGDALKIRQALRNLIGNAIKYTPNDGTITLSLENESDSVNIKVEDTGYGIPPSDLPHIFDRFYRVRNHGHENIEGNGLGLAIVKSIVEQHGGNVSVTSEVEKGSCFTVSLPFLSISASTLIVQTQIQD